MLYIWSSWFDRRMKYVSVIEQNNFTLNPRKTNLTDTMIQFQNSSGNKK